MIEIIICITIICMVVGTIARYRINESSKRIKELEEKLDRCYMEREQRLRDKGLITSPQDTPAICEYSGLRPVEGYKEDKEEKVDKKETDTKKADINFMYKWIREKSGK